MKLCPSCQCCYEDEVLSCPQSDHSSLIYKRPGSRLIQNKYRLDQLLGRGGMGTVYRCTHLELNNPAAIKILLPDSAGADPYGRQRMRREALIACRLNHPNLVRVHDCGTNVIVVKDEEGSHRYEEFFLVMDLLEGQSLRDYLFQKGALPLKEALTIARQVADGLAELHSKGILHRDIKPANIMLTRDYRGELLVKIVDLGAVKFVERSLALDDVELTGNLMVGSARYTSPENCKGIQLDERSDIYCLGLILYEMLAGRPAFVSNDRVDLIYKQAYMEPLSLGDVCPGIPDSVVGLVKSSLEKSPEHRPQSATEFAQVLFEIEASVETNKTFATANKDESEVAEETQVVVRPASAVSNPFPPTGDEISERLPEPNGLPEEVNKAEVAHAEHPHYQSYTDAGTAFASETVPSRALTVDQPKPSHEGRRIALALTYFLAFILTMVFLAWSLLTKAPAAAKGGDAPATSGAATEAQADNLGDEFITVTDVNVRSGPSKGSPKVGLAEKGSRVRVLSMSGNWREVIVLEHGRPKADESSSDQGWIDGGLLASP